MDWTRYLLIFSLISLSSRATPSSTPRAVSNTDPYPLFTISIPQDTSSIKAALQIIKSKPPESFLTDRINQITIALAPSSSSSSSYYGGMENCALNILRANILGFSQQQQGRFILIKFTTQSPSSSSNNNGDDNLAVIDCGGLNSRFMVIQGPGYKDNDLSSSSSSSLDRMNVVIERLDIRNGKYPDPYPLSDMGGGCIFGSNQANLRIEKSKISGCWAVNGGGVMVAGRSSLVLIDSLIKNNGGISGEKAVYMTGGGVAVYESSVTFQSCIFDGNWIVNNSTLVAYGAAIGIGTSSAAVVDSKTVWCIINQTTFSGNWIMSRNLGRIYGAGVYSYFVPIFITSSSFINNSLLTSTDSASGATVIDLYTVSSFSIQNSTFDSNTAIITGRGTIEGGAMSIIRSTGIISDSTIRNHLIQSTSYSSLTGGAMHIFLTNVNISRCLIENNAVETFSFTSKNCSSLLSTVQLVSVAGNGSIASSPFILPSLPTPSLVMQRNEIANFKQCKATQTISDECGVISDGYTLYPANLDCSWSFSPPPMSQIRLRFVFSIIRLSIDSASGACLTDYLQIFDGPSTTSAVIGKYCISVDDTVGCVNGPCPSFDNIVTSYGVATVVFHSDASAYDPTLAGGFILAWKMIDQATVSPPLGSSATSVSSFTRTPAGRGGAFHIYGGQVIISDSIIRNNSIDHPLAAVGGGIILRSGGTLISINSMFSMNSVSGSAATGGAAIAAIEASSITIISSNITNNINTASGSCFKYGLGIECASGWGGGLFVAQASSGRILSSRIDMNSVMCSGDDSCSARGGGIAIAGTASSLEIGQGSIIFSNSGLEGGGIGVIEDGKMMMSTKTQCINNTVAVLAASSSLSSSSRRSSRSTGGGCIWANSASTLTIDESEMSMNNGDGSGGAIYILDSCQMNMTRSKCNDNTAIQGGAMWINTRSSVMIRNSAFKRNQATVSGGAIGATLVNTLMISDNSSFIDNRASQASMLWVADQSASIQISSSNIISSKPGNWVNCIGDLVADENTTWNCSHDGTVFNMQYQSGSYFGLSCDVCNEGTYSANEASESGMNATVPCKTCPFGAKCHPAERNASGVFSIGGYWGLKSTNISNPEITMLPCLSGYCCEKFGDASDDRRCKYNQCAGGRNGTLCGQCPQGYGFSFFSSACGPNGDCKDAGWAIPLAFLAAIILCLVLMKASAQPDDGTLEVTIFFYQVAPFAKSTMWRYTTSIVIGLLQSAFNMTPPDSGSNNNNDNSDSEYSNRRICIIPSMTTRQKLLSTMAFQAMIAAGFGVVYLVHYYVHQLSIGRYRQMGRHKQQQSSSWMSRMVSRLFHNPPTKRLYFPALGNYIIISYLTFLLIPLQMVQCIVINDEYRWWYNAEVKCLDKWQIFAVVAAIALSPVPLLFGMAFTFGWIVPLEEEDDKSMNHTKNKMSASRSNPVSRMATAWDRWMNRFRRVRKRGEVINEADEEWRRAVVLGTVGQYRETHYWWLAVSMYRRMLIVLTFTQFVDLAWKSIALISLFAIFLMIHLVVRPFRTTVAHRGEIVSLLILCILSATSSPQLSQIQYGSSERITNEVLLEWVQLVLICCPLGWFLWWNGSRIMQMICSVLFGKERNAVSSSSKDANEQNDQDFQFPPLDAVEQDEASMDDDESQDVERLVTRLKSAKITRRDIVLDGKNVDALLALLSKDEEFGMNSVVSHHPNKQSSSSGKRQVSVIGGPSWLERELRRGKRLRQVKLDETTPFNNNTIENPASPSSSSMLNGKKKDFSYAWC